jgi:hypothetical protein
VTRLLTGLRCRMTDRAWIAADEVPYLKFSNIEKTSATPSAAKLLRASRRGCAFARLGHKTSCLQARGNNAAVIFADRDRAKRNSLRQTCEKILR